jgi:two-component system, cell cycle response regulator
MKEEKQSRNRILIAEDDPVSRRVLQAFLAKWGFEVVSALDGAEAARILATEDAPQLAILDWMMPGIEGPQVCRRVRERTDRPYTYILLLTARTQKEDVFLGLESGADDYLTKPFDAQELRARLHVGQRILGLQSGLIAAREELRFQATHDPLTDLWNHAVVIDAMDREVSRQIREGGSFGIILLDLDHFKRVNDTYGHLAGDAVLKETARRITASVRPYDIVGRYGGEELLIVVPSCDGPDVMRLAERIRDAIGSVPFNTDAGAIHVTASCGVCVGGRNKSLDSQALLQMADQALYRAKRNGRNRSELARVPDLPGSGPSSTTAKASTPHVARLKNALRSSRG